MNKLIFLFVLCLLSTLSMERAYADVMRKKKVKTEEAKLQAKEKPSVYDRLFKDEKKHTVSRGTITIHRYEEKLYLELPLKLIGRDFLISSVIDDASDITLSGTPASKAHYLIVDKTDSLILFRLPRNNNVRINSNDNQKRAFELSATNAIKTTFPIKGYINDSTAVLFDATSYFSSTNKDLLDVKGRSYGGMLAISDFSVQKKTSYINHVEAFKDCISVGLISSVKLSLNIMGFEVTEKPEMTLSLQTTLTVLPETKMHVREANSRVGTGYVPYMDYRNINSSKEGYYVTKRRDIKTQPIVFYVDTLFKESWVKAIRQSADAWNQSFGKIGIQTPIILKPYPKDSAFHSTNPLLNKIAFINNDGTNITAYNITDLRTGEILSTQIGISRDFAATVRKKGVYQMADVDERFRTYYIPDDLVCEGLSAYMLKAFGRSLGLVTNLAGSMAYSPEQLRSSEFTQEYGITASVMDDVLYNYLAKPGDKEKGVALIINKPGVCDEFTLKYLYAPIAGNENDTLKEWVMSHDGDIRYFYGKSPVALASDPRCQRKDLGNDPFAAVDAKIEHLKYVVKHSPEWFTDDNIPKDYRELFPDFVFIEWYNNSLTTLFPYIGGVYLNEPDEESQIPSFQSVPYAVQKKAALKILDVCKDLTWMDANRNFLYLGGVNTRMSDWVHMNGVPVTGLMYRLLRMGLSVDKAKVPYTQENYLTDVEKYLFSDVRVGKRLSSDKIPQIAAYISSLITLSPTLKAIQKAKMESGNSFVLLDSSKDEMRKFYIHCNEPDNLCGLEDVSGMKSPKAIYYYSGADIENICYRKLTDARKYLQRAKRLYRNEIDRGKCDFLIMMIDRVL